MADDDDAASAAGGADTPKKDRKKQIKNEHILIAVGVVTLLVMYYMMKKSQAAQQSTTAATTSSPYGQAGSGGYSYPASSGYNGYAGNLDGLAQEMAVLQQEITGLQSPSVSTTPVSPTTLAPGGGSGFTTSPPWTQVTSQPNNGIAQQVQNDLNSGIPVEYIGTPGASPVPVGVSPGGGWTFGGSTSAPGNASAAPVPGQTGYFAQSAA